MTGMDRRTGRALAGADHLAQSVEDILSTPIGTRIGRRGYGSDLPELLDQPMNALGTIRLYAATALALSRQEPRLRLSRVAVAAGSAAGAFALRLTGTRTDAARPAPLDLTIPIRALSALAA